MAPAATEARVCVPATPSSVDHGRSYLHARFGRYRLRARSRSVEDDRVAGLKLSLCALLASRALVWAVGVGAVLAFGFGPARSAYHPPGLTSGFGALGNLLAAPAARWDGAWYLTVAHFGYVPSLGPFTAARAAFFPLYPLLVSIVATPGIADALAGVIVSLVSLLLALYGIERLTLLELGGDREVARLAVLLTAFGPMAFFLSADYSESLYLALSVWMFLAARERNWVAVGVLGGLAAATRSTGVVLILPALLLYLTREAGETRGAGAAHPARDWQRAGEPHLDGKAHSLPFRRRSLLARLPSAARLRDELAAVAHVDANVLWLALIPAGLIAYLGWMWLAGGELLAPFHAQALWGRRFAGPFVACFDGFRAAFEGARQLISGQSAVLYFPLEGKSAFIEARHNIMLFAFLLFALVQVVGVARRLPRAYLIYVLCALALPLSYPVAAQPLMSLPRFLLVLFPLTMWLAAYLAPRRRAKLAVLALSVVALIVFGAQFSTWHWVA